MTSITIAILIIMWWYCFITYKYESMNFYKQINYNFCNLQLVYAIQFELQNHYSYNVMDVEPSEWYNRTRSDRKQGDKWSVISFFSYFYIQHLFGWCLAWKKLNLRILSSSCTLDCFQYIIRYKFSFIYTFISIVLCYVYTFF